MRSWVVAIGSDIEAIGPALADFGLELVWTKLGDTSACERKYDATVAV